MKKAANTKNGVCLDVRGAGFGQPIGVSGCHHGMGNQVKFIHSESTFYQAKFLDFNCF